MSTWHVGSRVGNAEKSIVERIRTFYQDNEARLAVILNEGRQARCFRFTGDVQATATLIFSLLEGGILIMRAYGGTQRFHAVIEQLMQFVKG